MSLENKFVLFATFYIIVILELQGNKNGTDPSSKWAMFESISQLKAWRQAEFEQSSTEIWVRRK